MISPTTILASAMETMKDQFFRHGDTGFSLRQRGLLFAASLNLHFNGYLPEGKRQRFEEASRSRLVYVLYYANTAVWTLTLGVGDRMNHWYDAPIGMWEFEGAHDSCWRGRAEQRLSRVWLQARDEMLADIPEQYHGRIVRSAQMTDSSHLGERFARGCVWPVMVDLKREEQRGYHPYGLERITVCPDSGVRWNEPVVAAA